ncbi:hypothetical protein TWF506_010827 [Arthrobotrys conoides]|uniref:Uncharacterized protein n=1 Tax=Arthrobotrys conoides TaxID=74498 RepID=A0AAN8N9F6_9PEZI
MYDAATEVTNRTHHTFKLVESTLGQMHAPPDLFYPKEPVVLYFSLGQHVKYEAQEDSNVTFTITITVRDGFETQQDGISLDVEPKGDNSRANIYIN